MKRNLQKYQYEFEEPFIDDWMNPFELSYTVSELWELARRCGVEIEARCGNLFDKQRGSCDWDMLFDDLELQERFTGLDDRSRWQVTNLLRQDFSPMLWFYLRPADHAGLRISETERDERFLDAVFRPSRASERSWALDRSSGHYPVARPGHEATVRRSGC